MREDRPLSLEVEARTGVAHQSPQLICLRDGKPSWHASHHAISAEAIERHGAP